jgi:hypothetical protein
MPRNFSLIKSQTEPEKRVLPRFPFCFLTLKLDDKKMQHAMEVKDISYSGMQVQLKDGNHGLKTGQKVRGTLYWHQQKMSVQAEIKWTTPKRLGLAFEEQSELQDEVREFLSLQNIIPALRPIHSEDIGIELPVSLRYWLRADGPVEVFIWSHNDREHSKFQFIMFENFVEWEDGEGLQTGRVLTKRDVDTPLLSEDEFVFQIDTELDEDRLDKAVALIESLSEKHLPEDVISFLSRKLNY